MSIGAMIELWDMKKETKNKRIALVTGANQGVGLQVVKELVEAGHTVFLGSRDLAKGEAAAKVPRCCVFSLAPCCWAFLRVVRLRHPWAPKLTPKFAALMANANPAIV